MTWMRWCLYGAWLFAALCACSAPVRNATPPVSAGSRDVQPSSSQLRPLGRRSSDSWVAGSGNWSDAANWSSGTPQPLSDASIDTTTSATVTIDAPAQTGTLALNATDTLAEAPLQTLTINGSTFVNPNLFTVSGGGIILGNGNVLTLSGGGTVTLGASQRLFGSGTFINADNLMSGTGQIGLGELALENDGIMRALGGTLTVQPNSNGMVNGGSIEGGAGGTLVIYGTTTQKSTGFIKALDKGIVQLHSPVIGGTVESAGSGAVQVLAGTSPTLDGVTVAGLFDVLSAGTTTLVHTITDNGTIALNSTGAGTDLLIQDAVTLNGTGKITMSNNQSNFIGMTGTNPLLANHITIQGAGSINAPFDNLSVINANKTMPLVLAPSRLTTDTNEGTIEASNGGTLIVVGGTLDNHNGRTIAANASQVDVQGTIAGGVLGSQGSGAFYGQGGTLDGTAATLTNNGLISVTDSNGLTLAGTFKNNGTIQAVSTGHSTGFGLANSTTLQGPGTLSLTNAYISTNAATLLNQSTIRGSGALSGMILQNAGTIAVTGGSLTVTPDSTGFTTSGTVSVAAGSSMTVKGLFTETAGVMLVSGSVAAEQNLSVKGGVLEGGGSITGNVTSSGTLQAGNAPQKPGIFTVTGNYAQGSGGALDVSIGGAVVGSQYDRLSVSGSAALGGTLKISVIGGFTPPINSKYQIVSASSLTGKFSSIVGSHISSTRHFVVQYQSNGVQLIVKSGP